MIQLRYNGCADCRDTAEGILRALGYFKGRDYSVEFHSDHSKDKLYEVRKDYLTSFTGAILYNTETQRWYDFYNSDGSTAMLPNTQEKKATMQKLVKDLIG